MPRVDISSQPGAQRRGLGFGPRVSRSWPGSRFLVAPGFGFPKFGDLPGASLVSPSPPSCIASFGGFGKNGEPLQMSDLFWHMVAYPRTGYPELPRRS